MKNNNLSMFLAAALLAGAGTLVIQPEPARAQSSTTGALRGQIKDKATGETLVGATVVATSSVLQGEQVVITDENGLYFVDNLPPGTYTLTVFYNDAKFSRGNVLIQVGKQAVVNVPIDTSAAAGGQTIVIEGRAPIVDQGSTKTGVTLTDEYTNNIPVGRTFGAVLASAPGSQGDQYGISFGGATSAENTYIVEGINTTDTAYGLLSSNLPNEFISETEVITGGYNAEFGRSTGGVVNVVTKQGSNDFKGSVYAYYTPGQLVASAKEIKSQASAVGSETNLDYRADVGGEIGGPIIKDKLWFHVGFNPNFTGATVTRSVNRRFDRVDAMGNPTPDGIADFDPDSGLTLQEEIDSRDLSTTFRTLFFTAKINGALSQNHQFQVSAFGNPRHGEDVFGITRNPAFNRYQFDDGAYDLAAKWSSKFLDGKTQIDAVAGFHRGFEDQRELGSGQNVPYVFYFYTRPLHDFADLEGPGVSECDDTQVADPDDPMGAISNCPVLNYSSQGLGFLEDRTNDRMSGVISLTQRVSLGKAGIHTFKAGADIEFATYDSNRRYSGDVIFRRSANTAAGASGRWQRRRFLNPIRNLTDAEVASLEDMDPANDFMPGATEVICGGGNALCAETVGGLTANTNNRSIAAYIQDSWNIRPNLTLNAGVRWEQQTAYVGEALQGKISPEGEIIPDEAFKLNNMIAPRIGLIYDPTQEGRSKIFGHWGRFYEQVPMDINVRAFGGEITQFTIMNLARVDADPNCNVDHGDGGGNVADRISQCTSQFEQGLLGDGTEFVQPGLKGQFIQELIFGTEYEFAPDFTIGANYVHRSLPIAIEDISTDGGNTYLIANPGEDQMDAFEDLMAEAERLRAMGETDLADLNEYRANQMLAIGRFDKPRRLYDALQVTARQRPTKNSLLLASYTYSRSVGNFPGLFSTETGQLDPNLTSMYDLPDLMGNRFGALGHDRPHLLKIDGFYQFDFKQAGVLTLGAGIRAQSGIPHNALAAHPTYQTDESYLLPRGAIRRSPVTWEADVRTQYGRNFGKNLKVEVFADIFNLLNSQNETDVDERYTADIALPIIGGDLTDAEHSKTTDGFNELNLTPTKNKNFGRLNARQAPLSMRFGVRVTF